MLTASEPGAALPAPTAGLPAAFQLRRVPPAAAPSSTRSNQTLQVGRHRLVVTQVFDSYWRFARARHDVYEQRLAGIPGPWSRDPVLCEYRFTNAFRAADRVSQALLRVQREGSQEPDEILFRTLLFRFFNRPETFDLLAERLGAVPSPHGFDRRRYEAVLGAHLAAGGRLYSAAYIIPAPPLGRTRKHENHLALLEHVVSSDVAAALIGARSLRTAFRLLSGLPGLGSFLAYQLAVDLGYAAPWAFDESDDVVAGPGALSGLRKCFVDTAGLAPADVIRCVVDVQVQEFARRDLRPVTLRGRPLQLVDCQNLFCEIDKYARVHHPDAAGLGNRTRIKRRFDPAGPLPAPVFPAHWGVPLTP